MQAHYKVLNFKLAASLLTIAYTLIAILGEFGLFWQFVLSGQEITEIMLAEKNNLLTWCYLF